MGDLLRTCVLDYLGFWNEILSLVEFAYNNNYHASIRMTPYEALYGKKCKTSPYWYQDQNSVLVEAELLQ